MLYQARENLLEDECCRASMQLLCAILGPDGKWNEDNLCELPGKGNYFAKKARRGCSPHSSGNIQNMGKTEKQNREGLEEGVRMQ